MKGRLGDSVKIFTAMMCVLVSTSLAYAGDFPGAKPNRQVIKTQQKVDKLFEKGDYDRAFFIYRQELTPLGDKYAQYMVGYMTIVGKGTNQDFILGSAWYRLAAERGDKNFAKARDEILAYFNDEQMAMSDQRYAELRMQYSDAMIVAKFIEEDLEIVSEQASSSASLSYSATESVETNRQMLERRAKSAKNRIETRIGYLENSLTASEFMSAEEKARIGQVLERAAMLGIGQQQTSRTGSDVGYAIREVAPQYRYASEGYEGYRPDSPATNMSGNSERTLSPAPASP